MDTTKWDAAYEAIRQESMENQEEVMALTKDLLLYIGERYPLSLTLAAALFTAAVSGAGVVLSATTPTQPVDEG